MEHKHTCFYFSRTFFSCRFEDPASTPSLRSPKFASAPPSLSFKGWFTFPYYSCIQRKWIISYSIAIASVKHPEWVHYIKIYCGINQFTSLFYINNNKNSLRGFLSIDIDVSGLYINQFDISNQFYSDSHHNSNFRYNSKFNHNQHQSSAQLFTHPIVSLQTPSTFHQDNEIDAFHDSHKCHRDSMDVSTVIVVTLSYLQF